MKVVLIYGKYLNSWEALSLGYIGAYLKSNLKNIEIAFYQGCFDDNETIIKGCLDADIVAFSCTSPTFFYALNIARALKKNSPWIHTVVGGCHSSALPEDCMVEGVDQVVIGEGEVAMLDIVKGNREKIVKKPYIKDLDFLPFPDRSLIKQERNIQQAFKDNGYRIASIFSSRGCPFKCTFCASHTIWSRKVRYRSADNILDEFEQLVKDLKIDFVKFSDDTFVIKKELVREFCEKKLRRNIKTHWGCNIRPNLADEELLRLMKKAGCKEVWIGVESGSPKILKEMRKDIDLDKIRWVFELTAKLGFFRRAYMLLGMPEESLDDIKLSERIVDEIKPDAVGFTILAPYPGTLYYNPELHRNVDWSTVDEYENRITRTKFLSNEDLHREQQRLISKYRKNIVFRQRYDACC